MPRSTVTTVPDPGGGNYSLQPSEVPVIVIRQTLPGIQIRLLADRDAGVIQWETLLLDDAGEVTQELPTVRLGFELLLNLEAVVDLLFRARTALTPRRRLDLARLEEPDAAVPPSLRKLREPE